MVFNARKGEDGEMKDIMIGVDLAKQVFQFHGAQRSGEIVFRKKLSRDQFQRFMAAQPACLVVFEACGSAHHWARQMAALGHDVGLPLSGGPVSVLVHYGSWRYSWGGRRSGSGWRSRPLDGLGSWRAIPQ